MGGLYIPFIYIFFTLERQNKHAWRARGGGDTGKARRGKILRIVDVATFFYLWLFFPFVVWTSDL